MSRFSYNCKVLKKSFLCICSCSFRQQILLVNLFREYSSYLENLLKDMKKGQQLRHLKYRDKRNGVLPAPSLIEVQVIGSGGQGLPRSVLLSTDHSKYLFNCGEGTQRLASEFKWKMSRTENVFITHMNWTNIGGLLGMCLTLENTGVPKIAFHGPPGVENVVKMTKGFSDLSSTLTIEKCSLESGSHNDHGFKIEYVPFYKEGFSHEQLYRLSQERQEEPERKVHRKQPVENAVAVAYIIWIYPDQVLSDPEKVPPILVVDCPSEAYLASFVSSQQLSLHLGCANDSHLNPILVVHMTPLRIFQLDEYQQWLGRFNSSVKHLIVNESTSDVGFTSVYRYQTCLHLIHPTVFPHLRHHSPEAWSQASSFHDLNTGVDSQQAPCADHTTILAQSGLSYILRPKYRRGICSDQCSVLNEKVFLDEIFKVDGVEEAMDDLRGRRCDIAHSTGGGDCSFPRFTFLGTGSSVPNKARNVSCVVVHLTDESTLLLDCGEGSFGQLYRHYGNKTGAVLRNLKAIFVSHMHSDHHIGLFSLLHRRKVALEEIGEKVTPLLLLSPIQMARWLQFYSNQVENVQALVRHVPLQRLLPHVREQLHLAEVYQEILQIISLTEFLPVEVDHIPNSFGVVLSHCDGWRLVYSGDTMPCQRLVSAGRDCDLLIHEATHADNLAEESKRKCHSTISQAISIGRQMNAKFILLTHFSQRYSKVPFLDLPNTENIGIAFDNMSVSMRELPLLPHFIPILKTLFSQEHAEMESAAQKKSMKKELMLKMELERRLKSGRDT